MRERDRIERQAWERQHAAEEQAADERRLAPVRAAEAELAKTAGKLRAAERETALNGTGDFETALTLLSDAMKQVTPERGMTEEQASAFNEREGLRFVEQTPDFYQCPENADLMTSFCNRHGIMVADAETWRNLFRHLDALGLIKHRPAPAPEPEVEQPAPAPTQTEFQGVDESGRPKVYTRAEIDRMSADEYRRYMRIPTKAYAEYEEAGIIRC